jgi:hypothetical protein
MPWHHVIPKHEWKRRFGNLNGFNAHDNQINLSHENHTQLHVRYGEEGSGPDMIAGKAMSGRIGKEEAQRQATILANTGKKYALGHRFTRPKEWKLQKSKDMVGNRNASGRRTEAQNLVNSISHIGKKQSPETVAKRVAKLIGKQPTLGKTWQQLKVGCPHCPKIGGAGIMKRWHFNNCKKRMK